MISGVFLGCVATYWHVSVHGQTSGYHQGFTGRNNQKIKPLERNKEKVK